MEAAFDPTTNGGTLTLTDIEMGAYAGRSIVFQCGVFDGYADLGPFAGIALFADSEAYTTRVDNFAHSGSCFAVDSMGDPTLAPTTRIDDVADPNPEENDEDCQEECSTFLITNGVWMMNTVSGSALITARHRGRKIS